MFADTVASRLLLSRIWRWIPRPNVQHLAALPGQPVEGLEHEGGLADAGVASDQHQRAGHEPAPRPGRTLDGGKQALLVLDVDRVDGHRVAGATAALRLTASRPSLPLLDEAVPGAAVGAFSKPLSDWEPQTGR